MKKKQNKKKPKKNKNQKKKKKNEVYLFIIAQLVFPKIKADGVENVFASTIAANKAQKTGDFFITGVKPTAINGVIDHTGAAL